LPCPWCCCLCIQLLADGGHVLYYCNCRATGGTAKPVACKAGYGIQAGKCVRCTERRCTSCAVNAKICRACEKGYGVDRIGKCAACKARQCTACASDAYKCWACAKGFTLRAGQCVRQVPGCGVPELRQWVPSAWPVCCGMHGLPCWVCWLANPHATHCPPSSASADSQC
jgi:hypothetical protein